jgi:hypothetical protein
MLDIIRSDRCEPIGLEQLVEHVAENVDCRDQASIAACSDLLGQLGLNRTFLVDYVLNGLKSGLGNFETTNRYTPPSLVLAVGEGFIVRANLWRATDTFEKVDLNVYGLAHDHNFDFLTLNYSGTGYVSRMFLYDSEAVEGRLGEKVVLRNNGTLQLKPGEMFLYRKSKDVHCQLPPSEDSITINIMATIDDAAYPNQYIFDLCDSTITDILGGFHRQEHVFAMALAMNDDECTDVLRGILGKTECALTKSYLTAGLGLLDGPAVARR